jgi:hypothetical protein
LNHYIILIKHHEILIHHHYSIKRCPNVMNNWLKKQIDKPISHSFLFKLWQVCNVRYCYQGKGTVNTFEQVSLNVYYVFIWQDFVWSFIFFFFFLKLFRLLLFIFIFNFHKGFNLVLNNIFKALSLILIFSVLYTWKSGWSILLILLHFLL